MATEVPLIVFVNTRSGGLQGQKILDKLKKYVPNENIFDLAQGGPYPGLQKYRGSRFRVMVCGGDGSVGWVLTEIEKLKLSRELTPPVAILPIGTGNDLSRVLKWGGSHNGKDLKSFIARTEKACVVLLDKWKISYEGQGDPLPHNQHYMNNYFSIGADANIALQFHEMRVAHPERFTSRAQNLSWYMRLGLQNLSPELLSPHVTVEINGRKVELPEQTRCVLVLNLPSYSGGGNPWGTHKSRKKKFASPAVDDGLLEVVAVNGPLQLVGIHANIIRGKRLGQGNNVKITVNKVMPAQVDGEPWRQPSSSITIQHAGKSLMLANSHATHPLLPLATNPVLPPSILAREGSLDSSISTSSARSLMRSTSTPITHTLSPMKYGPIPPSKRKKGHLYCDGCGLEFYLPYMLDNHLKSGLCSVGSSSSPSTSSISLSPPPINTSSSRLFFPGTSIHQSLSSADASGEPPRAISMQVDDGATTHSGGILSEESWRNKSAEVSSSNLKTKYEVEDDDEESDEHAGNNNHGTSNDNQDTSNSDTQQKFTPRDEEDEEDEKIEILDQPHYDGNGIRVPLELNG